MMFGLALFVLATQDDSNLCANANTTADIVECTGIVLKMADEQMSHAWQLALARMRHKDREAAKIGATKRPTYADALLDSQRKWLAFRDSQCLLESIRMRGGSGEGYGRSNCLIEQTSKRAATLRDIDF